MGIANGLAWTSVGGEMLPVEVAVIPNGTGKIEITGSLGDVMKESAQLAVTYAKVHAEEYGITPDKFKNTDLHIHAPEGAVPKDGPSAGVTLTTALISALSGIPVNHDLAMTGEITLHGNVLPIGGLKEKSMAAFREGISTVLIPKGQRRDLYEVDDEVKKKVRSSPWALSEVLKHALVRPGRTPARAVRGVPQATSLIANDKPAEGHARRGDVIRLERHSVGTQARTRPQLIATEQQHPWGRIPYPPAPCRACDVLDPAIRGTPKTERKLYS